MLYINLCLLKEIHMASKGLKSHYRQNKSLNKMPLQYESRLATMWCTYMWPLCWCQRQGSEGRVCSHVWWVWPGSGSTHCRRKRTWEQRSAPISSSHKATEYPVSYIIGEDYHYRVTTFLPFNSKRSGLTIHTIKASTESILHKLMHVAKTLQYGLHTGTLVVHVNSLAHTHNV